MQSVLDEVEYDVDNGLPPPIETEEYMKLREDDKIWLKGEIATGIETVVETFKPQGLNKLNFFIRQWGGVVLYVTVVGILLAAVVALGGMWANAHSEATQRLANQARFEQQTTDNFTEVNRRLSEISKAIQTQRDGEILLGKTGASPKAIGDAANSLKAQGAVLSRNLVVNAGQSLLKEVSSKDGSERWSAATDVLSYLSFLNRNFTPPVIEQTAPEGFATGYLRPQGFTGIVRWMGDSRPPDVPQMHPIGAPDANEKLKSGPAYLMLDGGTISLDGMVMKRIIIQNARVVYDGGALSLTNVYFVNCTFSVSHEKKGILFADAIMSPNAQTNLIVS
jgi:hypothetical protein